MAWQTPKTDWAPSQQGLSNADFNRIEGNIDYLKNAFDRSKFIHFSGSWQVPDGTEGLTKGEMIDVGKIVILPPGYTLKVTIVEGLLDYPEEFYHAILIRAKTIGRLESGDVALYAEPIISDTETEGSNNKVSEPGAGGYVHVGGLLKTIPSEATLRENTETVLREVIVLYPTIVRYPILDYFTGGTVDVNVGIKIDR